MNIFPVKRSDKVSSQLRKNIMCQLIIGMFQVFDLVDDGRSFIKIRL
jgi:hypothetical protein